MKVKFLPENVEFEIQPGQTVMNLAHEKGVTLHSTCNGMPSCAECRVKVVEGEHNLLPPSKKEMTLIGTGYYIDGRRLSCQMVCFGDVVVDTQEHLDRLGSGQVTKKFLSRVQKGSASESHSVGDVLIQKDGQLMRQLETSVEEDSSESRDHEMFDEMLRADNKKSQPQQQQPSSQKNKNRGNRNRRRSRGRSKNRSQEK